MNAGYFLFNWIRKRTRSSAQAHIGACVGGTLAAYAVTVAWNYKT